MSSLPPNKNIPAPSGRNGDLVKRTGTEAKIEESMRLWHSMREERDEALTQLAETRTKIVELTAEKAVLQGRNLDLEEKYERLLVDFTTLRIKLETIGGAADTISLAVSELLSLSRSTDLTTRQDSYADSEVPEAAYGVPEPPRKGESIQDVAQRLVDQTEPLSEPKKAPSWLPKT